MTDTPTVGLSILGFNRQLQGLCFSLPYRCGDHSEWSSIVHVRVGSAPFPPQLAILPPQLHDQNSKTRLLVAHLMKVGPKSAFFRLLSRIKSLLLEKRLLILGSNFIDNWVVNLYYSVSISKILIVVVLIRERTGGNALAVQGALV